MNSEPPKPTRLRGFWLISVQAAWITVATLALAIVVLSIT